MRDRRSPRTALVVEDDDRLRDLYASVLKEAAFAVVAVSDGAGALRLIDRRTVCPLPWCWTTT